MLWKQKAIQKEKHRLLCKLLKLISPQVKELPKKPELHPHLVINQIITDIKELVLSAETRALSAQYSEYLWE